MNDIKSLRSRETFLSGKKLQSAFGKGNFTDPLFIQVKSLTNIKNIFLKNDLGSKNDNITLLIYKNYFKWSKRSGLIRK